MALLHLCNVNFEWELTQKHPVSIVKSLQKHPVFAKLQFLPTLYAAPEEAYLTTTNMPNALISSLKQNGIIFPHHYLFENEDFSPFTQIESWGFSESIEKWAAEKGLSYPHPPWSAVKEVNSKLFSFTECPKLPKAALLSTESETEKWLKEQEGPFVLKTYFGVSGRGLLIQKTIERPQLFAFLHKEWSENRFVIAEPWMERLLDFSTQWVLSDKEIIFQGATLCDCDAKGQYRQNKVGDEKELFGDYLSYLKQQCEFVIPLLKKIANRGYFGNVGIDAFIYRAGGSIFLHPVVEINARKTMGWAALKLQRRYFPGEMLALSFSLKTGFTFNTIRDK
jgi:hypothetical protein